jgi:predicted short-subunit dehydrogenase-like oxidoreductase (DUF2520 family)
MGRTERPAGPILGPPAVLIGTSPAKAGTIAPTPSTTARPTTVALIGAGRVATALGVLLERAGHHVTAVAGRHGSHERARRHLPFARFLEPAQAAATAEVVLFGVPDDLIAEGCGAMAGQGAFRPGQWVAHLSGSVGLDALGPAEAAGAGVLSLHPLQSVPDVLRGVERLPGSPMAVTARDEEGFGFGERTATAAGCRPFRLAEEVKPLYHAAAVFCSNYLVVVEAVAERLFGLAGIEDPVATMAPLARTTFDAALAHGPGDSLTGPAARGDAGTVARNLEALARRAPEVAPLYAALAREALDLATTSGRLSERDRERVLEVLDRWR